MVDNIVYLSVSDLNFYISQKFKNDPYLHKVFLQGELSNFRFRMNSHQYFSLKDEKSKINVVMFRSFFEKLKFKPEEGMKVYVSGYVDVYGPQGSYQFYAQTMEPAGLGALYEQLRQLQEKLAKEGLFNEEHKKKLPLFPDRIAVVTSASGAVIHDIMVTANRRFPHAEIDLYPAKVQGDEAADKIVAALQQIQAQGDKYDVVIIGRGGGSLEDLWPFNEEKVVRQIYAMQMPVISSVGHETDTTLADLVADARAATPTAAAEYATPNLVDVLTQIVQLRARLYAAVQANIHTKRQILDRLKNAPVLQEPTRIYDQQIQQVDMLTHRLNQAMVNRLQHDGSTLRLLQERLKALNPSRKLEQLERERNFVVSNLFSTMNNYLKDQRNRLNRAMQQLDDISPLKTISRGYVYTTDQKGNTVTSVDQLKIDEKLKLHFKDGQVQVNVENIRREKNGNQEK